MHGTELAKQGVIYLPISEAVGQQPELMEKYFLKNRPNSAHKILWPARSHGQGRRRALCAQGSNQKVIRQLLLDGSRAAVFPHTLIIAEDNSKASVIDIFFSETEEKR